MFSACAPYWDTFLELDQYTKDGIILWKENTNFVKSRFCFFGQKISRVLDSLTAVHLVGVQLSLLSGNMFVISFGILEGPLKFRLGGNSPP